LAATGNLNFQELGVIVTCIFVHFEFLFFIFYVGTEACWAYAHNICYVVIATCAIT